MTKEITWNNVKETTFAENDYFLVLVFKENHVFIEEKIPSVKVIRVEKEPNGVDKNGIGYLVVLPRLVFIDEECENRNENLRWPLQILLLHNMGTVVN